MTSFLGQKLDFTGDDGDWYGLSDDGPSMHLNMRVTASVPAVPQMTYITGLFAISVADPHNLGSSCRPEGVSSPTDRCRCFPPARSPSAPASQPLLSTSPAHAAASG